MKEATPRIVEKTSTTDPPPPRSLEHCHAQAHVVVQSN